RTGPWWHAASFMPAATNCSREEFAACASPRCRIGRLRTQGPGDENTAGNFGRDAAGVLGHDSGGPRGDPAHAHPPTLPARARRPVVSPLAPGRYEVASPRAPRPARSYASRKTCNERAFIEFHHVDPHGGGGEATVENIQLRCRAHNAYEGELFYGHGRPTRPSERRTLPGKSSPTPPP